MPARDLERGLPNSAWRAGVVQASGEETAASTAAVEWNYEPMGI